MRKICLKEICNRIMIILLEKKIRLIYVLFLNIDIWENYEQKILIFYYNYYQLRNISNLKTFSYKGEKYA